MSGYEREEPADRIWAIRREESKTKGRRKTGDLQFPGIHTLLFSKQERQVQSEKENQQEEIPEEAERTECRNLRNGSHSRNACTRHHQEAESNPDRLFPLLRYY